MNEGWTTERVVTLLVLVLVLVVGILNLWSLEHGQEKIIEVGHKLDDIKSISIRLEGFPEKLVVEHRGQTFIPVQGPATGSGGHSDSGSSTPAGTATSRSIGDDGTDDIGRPAHAAPGFTIEPPLDREIPGRTIARRPEHIPELGGRFVSGITAEPDKINYYLTNDGYCARIDGYVHDRLFSLNPDRPQEIWPALAVAWETSEDKLTFLFHLRKGVRFSDGTPFDADDVIFSYETLMDPDVESEHLKSGFSDVASVRKVDRYTVEVRMRRRYWKALKQFGYSLRILPREYFEREIPKMAARLGIRDWSVTPMEPGFAAVFNRFTRVMAPGTGPYMWRDDSWVTNQHITLHAFEDSWIRKLNPDYYRIAQLRWRIVKDRVAMMEEFRKGGIDVTVVDHSAWDDQYSKDPTITGIARHFEYDHIGLLYSHVYLNCRKPPFNDPHVRRAFAHLVNRKAILEQLERGRGQIATCPTKPIYREYSHDIEPYPFDPGKASEILLKAGWDDTDGDGLLDKGGRPLEFFFSFPSGRTWYKSVSTLLQEACKSIGVRCKVDPKEWAVFVKQLYDRTFESAVLYASASDPWPDPYEEYHSSQVGPRAGNHSGWINPEVDRLLEAMRLEFDEDRRVEMFHRFNHYFHDELPELLLVHGKVGVLLHRRFQGARVRPSGLQTFDMWVRPEDWRR